MRQCFPINQTPTLSSWRGNWWSISDSVFSASRIRIVARGGGNSIIRPLGPISLEAKAAKKSASALHSYGMRENEMKLRESTKLRIYDIIPCNCHG